MPDANKNSMWKKIAFKQFWVLYALVIVVLLLSILAFNSPVSQSPQVTPELETIVPTDGDQAATDAARLTETLQAQVEPPTAEEIGFTDGIILWSTLLILILLVATLREFLRRKRLEG